MNIRKIKPMKIKSKKAQMAEGIIAFVVVTLAVILLAPIILKIFNSVVAPLGNNVASMSPAANQSAMAISGKFNAMWDYVVIFAFTANILILLVSAFLVDIHPAFLVVYILTAVFSLIFAPSMFSAIDGIYDNSQFTTEVGQLTVTKFIFDNFGVILLAVIALSGIIMYAKFKMRRSI